MNIEILDFVIKPDQTKIALVVVRYHDLIIKCELAFYVKDKKPWIRMPERWFNQTNKIAYCVWPTKEISDEFQKVVLSKIFDKYDLNSQKIEELHKTTKKKKTKK